MRLSLGKGGRGNKALILVLRAGTCRGDRALRYFVCVCVCAWEGGGRGGACRGWEGFARNTDRTAQQRGVVLRGRTPDPPRLFFCSPTHLADRVVVLLHWAPRGFAQRRTLALCVFNGAETPRIMEAIFVIDAGQKWSKQFFPGRNPGQKLSRKCKNP